MHIHAQGSCNGMSGSTAVCPGSTHEYTVTRSCQISSWMPTNGTVINTSGKKANVTWGSGNSIGQILAELYQCTQNPPTVSAWCNVKIYNPTPPTAFTPSNISLGAQTVSIYVTGGQDVSSYEWEYYNGNSWTSFPGSGGSFSPYAWTFNNYIGTNWSGISVTVNYNTVIQFRVRTKYTGCSSALYSNWYHFTPQRP